MRTFIIGALLLASTTPAFAKYTCGPNAATYAVLQPSPKKFASGVRCVVFPNDHSFAWYGEGKWGTSVYRHVGYARATGDDQFVGSAGDMGGAAGALFNRTLKITISHAFPQKPWGAGNPPSAIEIRGAWNEDWLHVPDGVVDNWNPLAKVSGCGGLQEWAVYEGNKRAGTRCVLKDGSWLTAWYGDGAWGANSYRHLGTADSGPKGNKWGAVDLCVPGSYCGKAPWGTLQITKPDATSIAVKGGWNEVWRR